MPEAPPPSEGTMKWLPGPSLSVLGKEQCLVREIPGSGGLEKTILRLSLITNVPFGLMSRADPDDNLRSNGGFSRAASMRWTNVLATTCGSPRHVWHV